jgi:hypothetical protein
MPRFQEPQNQTQWYEYVYIIMYTVYTCILYTLYLAYTW